MLWSLSFLATAMIAAFFGFFDVVEPATKGAVARVLFFVFLTLAVVAFVAEPDVE
jgi:uncharacterized membrane protein YtjA (UPF0391 family)